MTTTEQCEAIIRKIIELVNSGKPVQFEADWGGNTLTINVGNAHTHVGGIGIDDGHESPFEQLIEELYNSLHGGPGLSWHEEPEDKPADTEAQP